MKKCSVVAISLILLVAITGCGVKGLPQPPLAAPVLGRGEPSFSKATENLKIKKTSRTNDWDETTDFSEDKEK